MFLVVVYVQDVQYVWKPALKRDTAMSLDLEVSFHNISICGVRSLGEPPHGYKHQQSSKRIKMDQQGATWHVWTDRPSVMWTFPNKLGPSVQSPQGLMFLAKVAKTWGCLEMVDRPKKKMREKMMINIDETLTEFIKLLKIGMWGAWCERMGESCGKGSQQISLFLQSQISRSRCLKMWQNPLI